MSLLLISPWLKGYVFVRLVGGGGGAASQSAPVLKDAELCKKLFAANQLTVKENIHVEF